MQTEQKPKIRECQLRAAKKYYEKNKVELYQKYKDTKYKEHYARTFEKVSAQKKLYYQWKKESRRFLDILIDDLEIVAEEV
jgi:spermidine/putrescine-binding protein